MLALPQDILVLYSVNLDNIQAPIEGKIEYLQVNALNEWIIGIYLHEFANNDREISIPTEAAECGIKTFAVYC